MEKRTCKSCKSKNTLDQSVVKRNVRDKMKLWIECKETDPRKCRFFAGKTYRASTLLKKRIAKKMRVIKNAELDNIET